MNTARSILFFITIILVTNQVYSQDNEREHPNIQWFKDAKFGMFIHWGVYAQLAGTWEGKRYYGSGEWIMHQAKIPAATYAKAAARFNPIDFNADSWAKLAKDAGIRYMVITAKHHEGFSMFDSKVSDYNIVKASAYGKDPMKALSVATRKQGIRFGFYYSQFLDWHEPNGGGNNWDFDESKKDYQNYYKEKSIPQLKELLTNYGPLGIVWFDMPGGLTKEQTKQLVDSLRILQPNCLFSSRVGQGLGDYRDFGDSEVPPEPITGAWESIYTHNDSWGYIEHDMNFKSPTEIIRLLANVASKGGNLMLNVGPDGTGKIPAYSVKYLRETGKWLEKNGESIYSTTYGLVPEQPWGVSTSKPGKLFLHLLNPPKNRKLLVPLFENNVSKVYELINKHPLAWTKNGNDLFIKILPQQDLGADNVIVVEYQGAPQKYPTASPVTVSSQYDLNSVDAIHAHTTGNAKIESLTFSYYFGDWKHATCVEGMQKIADSAGFFLRIIEPGDYKIILEYACSLESSNQEASVVVNDKTYSFRTLRSSTYDSGTPVMFIKHTVAITTITKPGIYNLLIHPLQDGKEIFKLKSILLEPVH